MQGVDQGLVLDFATDNSFIFGFYQPALLYNRKTNKHVISEKKDSDAKVYKRDRPEHNEPLLSFW